MGRPTYLHFLGHARLCTTVLLLTENPEEAASLIDWGWDGAGFEEKGQLNQVLKKDWGVKEIQVVYNLTKGPEKGMGPNVGELKVAPGGAQSTSACRE